MQAQRSRTAIEDDVRVEQAILGLLLSAAAREPWLVEEVVREIGDPVATEDALARLHGSGLVNRVGGMVLASRAAVRAHELMS